MKASIIVSDVVSQGMLLADMHALCTQDFPQGEYEVLLPDGGIFSTEERVLLGEFAREFPHFRVVKKARANRAALLNEAAKRAQGAVLLFIESHCLASRGWLAGQLSFLERERAKVALGGIKTVPTSSGVGQAEEDQRKVIMARMARQGTDKSYFDFHNVAITRECFWEMGGLAAALPIMAEFELGARLREKGIEIARSPSTVWHFNDTTLVSYARVIGQQGGDKARMLEMHGLGFMERYFPLPRTYKRLALLKRFRLPLIGAVWLLIRVGKVEFHLARIFGMRGLSAAAFRVFARNSHRLGFLRALR